MGNARWNLVGADWAFFYLFRSWRREFRNMFTRIPYISGKCITYLAVKSPRWKPLFAPTGVLLFVNRFSYKTWITENTTPVFVLFFGKGKHKSDACIEDVYLRLPSVTLRVVLSDITDHQYVYFWYHQYVYLFIRSESRLVGIVALIICILAVLGSVFCWSLYYNVIFCFRLCFC